LGQLRTAVAHRGEDISAILGNGAPASRDLARVSAAVDAEGPALRELVRASGRALQTIGSRQSGVRRLVTAGRDVLGATAMRDAELTRAVELLPGLQRRLRATLDAVDQAGRLAKPTLERLRGVAPQIRPALRGVDALAPELRLAFDRLAPIVSASRTTLPKLDGTLKLAGRLMARLAPAGRQLVPILQLLGVYRHEVVSSLANAGSATSPIISGHHGLRFMLTLDPESLYGQASQQGTWRSQPYPAPGEGTDLTDGKGAISCANAGNRTTVPISAAPPCVLGRPWTFQGRTALYPRVAPNAP
jgi:ABC-type transporter Mla subunit MlaD